MPCLHLLSGVCHLWTFSNIFSSETAGRIKSNFIWNLYGLGERKLVRGVELTWPRWPPCPYMVKTHQKSFSPEPPGWLPWNLVCSIGELGSIIVCSNDDPRMTMTYFIPKINFYYLRFYMKKSKMVIHRVSWSQIAYRASMGWGKKVCLNGPGHMAKMAAMPIYGKNPSKIFLQNQWADCLETWYVAFETGGPS